MERYANDFSTTLTAGIDADDTSIAVADAAPAALQGGEFRIRVDDEYMLVTATGASGASPWTVTRDAEEPGAAASHDSGAAVTHVVTAASLALAVDVAALVTLAPASSARNVIQPTGAAVVPLVVKGAASQSANIQEWQNSAGTVLNAISAGGVLNFNTNNVDPVTAPLSSIFRSSADAAISLKSAVPGFNVYESDGATKIFAVADQIIGGLEIRIMGTTGGGPFTPPAHKNALRPRRFSETSAPPIVNNAPLAATAVLATDIYYSGAGLTIPDAATLYVDAAMYPNPSSSGLTMTDAWALWVDSGRSRFDDDIVLPVAGKGITLKSPDGLTTKTVTIDNAGALALL